LDVRSTEAQATEVERPKSAHDHHFRTDHLMSDLKGRSIRGGAVTVSSQALKFILNTGSTAVLARLLTPADFGLIAMVAAFTGFVTLFRDLGLSTATVQRVEITHDQVSTLFWINVAMSVVLMLIAAALAPVIAWFYGEPRLTWIMLAISGTFPFGGLSAQHTALMRRQMRFTALAMVEIVSLLVGIAVAIVMAWRGFSYWSLVAMGAANGAATMAMCWLLSGWRPGLPRQRSGVMPMLTFGSGLTGFNILNYFTRNADNVIIGFTLGSGPLGIYSKAYGMLLMPIRQFNAPIAAVMQPALSRLQNDPVRYRRAYLRAVSMLAFIGMPLVAFLFVAADDVIRVFLGPGWGGAVPVFRWLAPAALLGTINVAPGWLCTTLGRSRVQVNWALFSAPITVASFLIGSRWGINGVAAGFSITWCWLLLLFIAMACRRSPVSLLDLAKSIGPILSAAIGATALCLWLMSAIGLRDAQGLSHIVASGLFFWAGYIALTLYSASGRAKARALWRDGFASLGTSGAMA
jgi:PST family polysaccharide transporter